MTLKEKAKTYRVPETTTSENLGTDWQTVITFGDKVLLAGYFYQGKGPSYFGAVFTFTGNDHSCEGKIKLTAISDEFFADNGHALQWAMAH